MGVAKSTGAVPAAKTDPVPTVALKKEGEPAATPEKVDSTPIQAEPEVKLTEAELVSLKHNALLMQMRGLEKTNINLRREIAKAKEDLFDQVRINCNYQKRIIELEKELLVHTRAQINSDETKAANQLVADKEAHEKLLLRVKKRLGLEPDQKFQYHPATGAVSLGLKEKK